VKRFRRISLTGQMQLGFTALIFIAVTLVELNIAEMLWIDYTQTRIEKQEETVQAANQMMSYLGSMDKDISYVSEAAAQGGAVRQLEKSFEADATALSTLLETAVQSAQPGSKDAASLREMSNLLDQYQATADAAFAAADQQSTQLTPRLREATSVGMQLSDVAAPYAEDMMALLDARQARLGYITNLCLIVTAVLGVIALAGGSVVGLGLARRIRRTLRGAVTDISNSASELLAVATQVSSGAAQTAASTSETTATVDEVKQTALLAQEKASQAAEGATGAVQNIGSARELTEDTASGIERMQDQMDTVFSAISTLSERAQEAGEIVASVNDLAEQSNLLSVNASIEAAKAGEYGKGFTVVAQEVKSLAGQSKQAVAQVRTMLGEIQKASQTAVEAATQSREAVEAGRQKSVQAGEALQRVAEGAREDAESSLQASASAQQQLAGMEQMAAAIESINQASAQAVDGTRQVDQEIRHLQDLAQRLRSMIEGKSADEPEPPTVDNDGDRS